VATARNLAGTPEDMQAAISARFNATDPYYKSLAGNNVSATPVLSALDSLEKSGIGQNNNVSAAINSIRQKVTKHAGPDGTIDADILSGLHQEAGSHLGPTASRQEKKALGPIKDAIAQSIDAGVPGYSANNQAFAQLSTPINTMGAVRGLLDPSAPGSLVGSGDPLLSATRIKGLLRSNEKARFPMAPEAQQQLEGVRDSLARRTLSDQRVVPGSETSAND
jgi:hypothetical protein